MAAVVITVSYDLPRAYRIAPKLGIITGKFVTDTGNYATGGITLDLTSRLIKPLVVLFDNGGGYVWLYVRNDTTPASAVVKCYSGISAHTHVFTGSALAAHGHVFTGDALATHAHDLVFKANAAANAVTMAANSLRNATAGDLTVAGGGADGGIAAITAGTPAGTNATTSGGTPAGTNADPAAGEYDAAHGEKANGVAFAATTVRFVGFGLI